MPEGTTTTTTTAATAGTLAADPAFAQFDAETQGHFKNHGWDQKPAAQAAFEALKSYREAEKFLGAPKDQLLRLPKDAADEAGWNAVYQRLGAPADAKEYDFKDVKFADGTALDDSFVETIRAAAASSHLSKDAALAVTKAVVKFMEGAETTETAERLAKLVAERGVLEKSWGANNDANKFIASNAAIKLGFTKEIVDALENTAGYAATMQAFLKVGQMIGEDKFVASGQGQTPGVLTKEQAIARLSERKTDSAWIVKLNAGDAAANREFNDLTTLIAAAGGF